MTSESSKALPLRHQTTIAELGEFLKRRDDELNTKWELVLSLASSWREQIDISIVHENDKKKAIRELRKVCEFICCYDNSMVILDGFRESPDFIISDGKLRIGVELMELPINPSERKTQGELASLFIEVEKRLMPEVNIYRGIYKIEFNKKLILRDKNRVELVNELVSLIKSQKASSKHISYLRNTDPSYKGIHLFEGSGYVVGNIEKEILEKAITKKEKKVSSYAGNASMDSLWLLLIVGGAGKASDYCDLDECILSDTFETSFDKIFVFDQFLEVITELKTSKPANEKI